MMRKLFFLALVFLSPLSAAAESITSFHADITPGSDGGFSVVETITYDFGDEERHGIYRTILTDHPEGSDIWFKKRVIEVEVLSITQDGAPAIFEQSRDLGELDIKIGDPDTTISGEHVYEITYRVTGGLFYYDDGNIDLYWNVTGNGWEVPIGSASATVHDPSGVALPEASCYIGSEGATDGCEFTLVGTAYTFGPVVLEPHEGLTIARALDPEKVETSIIEKWSFWPLWLIGAALWLLWLARFLYRYMVEHRTGNAIIAEYEPYARLEPIYTGILFDGQVDPRDITSGIVRLAERGFLKIKHVGRKVFFVIEVDDYELELLRPYSELNTEFDRTLFKLMFEENAAIGAKVVLSDLSKNFSKQKENFNLLQALRQAAEADLLKDGYFKNEWRAPLKVVGGLGIVLLVFLGITAALGADLVAPLIIAAITFLITTVSAALTYRRRTKKGYEALDHLKGFKEFLFVTDEERFKFHNAPKKSPEQFMAYLPYAIAFGVEKEWAKAFKDVTIPAPGWYDGGATTFNAVYLSQSLGTFGTSISSASGSSASSGGGSSGGGAGGGGGGSW